MKKVCTSQWQTQPILNDLTNSQVRCERVSFRMLRLPEPLRLFCEKATPLREFYRKLLRDSGSRSFVKLSTAKKCWILIDWQLTRKCRRSSNSSTPSSTIQ